MSDPTPPTGWVSPERQTPPDTTGAAPPDAAPTGWLSPESVAPPGSAPTGWITPDASESAAPVGPNGTGWQPPDAGGVDRTALVVVAGGCLLLVALVTAAMIAGLIVAGPQIAQQLRTIGERYASPAPSGTVSVYDLGPGDCFDEPSTAAETVDRLLARGCAEPHGAEVVSIEQVPGGPFAAYPGNSVVNRTADGVCTTAFKTYVGVTPERSDFDVTYYTVTEAGWADGDRSFDCIAVSDDGSTTSGSVRGINR